MDDLLDGGRLLPLVEDFYTIQGEGYHAGKPAYFIRLGGCDVGCRWCDARFTWNARLYPPTPVTEIVERAAALPAQAIVITGGEPTLYPLEPLTAALKAQGLEIFIETSGTHPLTGAIDWVCLSPKRQQPPRVELRERSGVGRGECRTGFDALPPLPATGVEPAQRDGSSAGGVRQSRSAVEHLAPDP